MKENNQERLQQKLKEIEAQLKSDAPLKPTPELSNSLQSLYQQFLIWYQGLPTWGKGGTIIVGLILSLSIFRTILNLISLGITLAVIGVGGYLAYKLFFAADATNNIKK